MAILKAAGTSGNPYAYSKSSEYHKDSVWNSNDCIVILFLFKKRASWSNFGNYVFIRWNDDYNYRNIHTFFKKKQTEYGKI